MAVNLTSAGGLLVKLGHVVGTLLDQNVFRGVASPAPPAAPDTTPTINTKVNTLVADYAAGTAERGIADGLLTQSAAWQTTFDSFLSGLQSLSQSTLIDMVNVDQAQPDRALATAMVALINNTFGPTGANFKVTASTLGAGSQTNQGSPTGSFATTGNSGPVIVASTRDGKGLGLDYLLAETLTLNCTNDAVKGSATRWQEPIAVRGQVNNARSQLDWLWPSGSGKSAALTCVDANQNNQGPTGNVLQNSEWSSATVANIGDNWIKDVGVVGTDILRDNTTSYRGDLTSSLEYAGDASTLSSVYQVFNATPQNHGTATDTNGGTSHTIGKYPDQPYAVNFWVKVDAGVVAGVLEVALTDGSGAIIADDQAANNSLSITLSGLTASTWTLKNVVFRLPASPPSTVRLRIRLSTALTTGKHVWVSHLAMTQMTQFYQGGPFLAAFSGNVAPLASPTNDTWTLALTNTWGNWQQAFQRLFDMRSLGMRLPTSGAGTAIDDVVGSGHLIS